VIRCSSPTQGHACLNVGVLMPQPPPCLRAGDGWDRPVGDPLGRSVALRKPHRVSFVGGAAKLPAAAARRHRRGRARRPRGSNAVRPPACAGGLGVARWRRPGYRVRRRVVVERQPLPFLSLASIRTPTLAPFAEARRRPLRLSFRRTVFERRLMSNFLAPSCLPPRTRVTRPSQRRVPTHRSFSATAPPATSSTLLRIFTLRPPPITMLQPRTTSRLSTRARSNPEPQS